MATKEEKWMKVNPEAHLKSLQKAETELLKNIKGKEKEVRMLIEEIKALRELIKGTARQVEEFNSDEDKEQEKESEEALETLEGVVEESAVELAIGGSHTNPQYASVTAQQLTKAANLDSMYELTQLANKDYLTEDEQYKFFEIQQAAKQSLHYSDSINPALRDTISQTYDLVKQVEQTHQEQIKQTYDVKKVMPPQPVVQQYTSPMAPPPGPEIKTQEYKPTPAPKIEPQKKEGPKKGLEKLTN